MAGCCPEVPPSAALGAAFSEANGPESDIRQGESVECYAARTGNTTGQQDDATGTVQDHIATTSVPLTRTATACSVNTTFTVTGPRVATSWTATPVPTGLTFSGATLSGSFNSSTFGQSFSIMVTASDGSGVIDSRSFTVAPSIGDSGTQISLQSPLPGAIVNSKFGPRLHPIQNVMKMHTGIDMKYTDHHTSDVLAAADGTVLLAGGNPASGYGIRVWIKHLSASGTQLCTTTYNHMSQVYVTVGQTVMAGQKIGHEGSTGASTGNHLHFEVKLPNGTFIDPQPLISGTLLVAAGTASNGEPSGAVTAQNSTASLSEEQAQAQQSSCQAFGPGYPPANPPETTDPTPVPALPSTDPFELAFFFVMQAEVGPFWDSSYPSDPDVIAGSIDTAVQRKKDGYVNTPNYPGGETKFGVAQKPNPASVVRSLTYVQAKNVGFNNYWKSSPIPAANIAPYLGIMMFDMNYLHGGGNARTMYNASGVSSVPVNASQAVQLAACQQLYNARVAFINRIPRPEFTRGWLARASACLAYIRTLPPL